MGPIQGRFAIARRDRCELEVVARSQPCRPIASRLFQLLHCEAPRADTGQYPTSSLPRLAHTWSCRLKVVRICRGMKSTWEPSAGGAPAEVTIACSSLT